MKPYVIASAQPDHAKKLVSFLTIINTCVSLFSTFTGLIGLAFCDRF